MLNLNKNGTELVEAINSAIKPTPSDEETISTSKQVLAAAYETARNAVEFRSKHLIRQAAIVRILKRRLYLRQSSNEIASMLIKELIWAKYLKNDSVPIGKIKEVESIFNKCKASLSIIEHDPKKEDYKGLKDWFINLAGCEIEECLIYDPLPQLLLNFVNDSLQPRIQLKDIDDGLLKKIQVYIAIERTFAKNSETYITYHLLKQYFPEWFQVKPDDVKELFPKILKTKSAIDANLNHHIGNSIKKQVSKMIAPFNVIREMVVRNPKQFVKTIDNQEEFDDSARKLLTVLYSENRKKTMDAMIRSIIYIFLTKMLLGLALELPYDLIIKKPNYMALGINMIFPPLFMVLLNAKIITPTPSNTDLILGKIQEYFFSNKEVVPIVVAQKEKSNKGKKYMVFLGFYVLTFIFIFTFIFQMLEKLGFNIVSKIIFIFFICAVSFFAYRVKKMSKEYIYQEYKEGALSSLFDFILLPILTVGQWISIGVSKLNFLAIGLDFLIEIPLKALLEVLEEWIHFVQLKKDEIIS